MTILKLAKQSRKTIRVNFKVYFSKFEARIGVVVIVLPYMFKDQRSVPGEGKKIFFRRKLKFLRPCALRIECDAQTVARQRGYINKA